MDSSAASNSSLLWSISSDSSLYTREEEPKRSRRGYEKVTASNPNRCSASGSAS